MLRVKEKLLKATKHFFLMYNVIKNKIQING